jgi:hypothetical protein
MQQEQEQEQLEKQVAWNLAALLRAAQTIQPQEQASPTLSPSPQFPQSPETQPSVLALPTPELPHVVPLSDAFSDTSSAPPPPPPPPVPVPTSSTRKMYKPQFKCNVWRLPSKTGDLAAAKKRKGKEKENPYASPIQRKRRRKTGAAGLFRFLKVIMLLLLDQNMA